jgi:hypothetical protein
MVKKNFVDLYGQTVKNYASQQFDFGPVFQTILKGLEEKEMFEKEARKVKGFFLFVTKKFS